jgi:hypothetical protein
MRTGPGQERRVRAVLPLGLVLGALAFPAAAAAGPPPPPVPAPAPAPPAAPAPSHVTVSVGSVLHARTKVVGVPGVKVRIRGTVTPYASGATVTVRMFRRGKRVAKRSRPLVQRGNRGRFGLWFRPSRRGGYVIRATVEVGGTRSSARPKRLLVVRPHAGPGSRGTAVRALQHRLAVLGYLTPVNGYYGGSTARAVLALRKVAGMARTTVATAAVFRKLARGGGSFHIRYPKARRHAEFDWSRQVLVLARGARPVKIVPASSGKPSTPTVFGHFHFYSKTVGFNSHGMYYSNYFVGGYAVHGYADVPTYPASHGCIRIPIPSAISIYRSIRIGEDIFVYR